MITTHEWMTLIAAITVSMTTGLGGYMAAHRQANPTKTAFDGLVGLVQQLRAQNHDLLEEIARLRATLADNTQKISEMDAHIDDLRSIMRQHGITPPIPRRTAKASAKEASS